MCFRACQYGSFTFTYQMDVAGRTWYPYAAWLHYIGHWLWYKCCFQRAPWAIFQISVDWLYTLSLDSVYHQADKSSLIIVTVPISVQSMTKRFGWRTISYMASSWLVFQVPNNRDGSSTCYYVQSKNSKCLGNSFGSDYEPAIWMLCPHTWKILSVAMPHIFPLSLQQSFGQYTITI